MLTENNVTQSPCTTPALVVQAVAGSAALLSVADHAKMLELLRMPDVTGQTVPMEMHEAADIVELRSAVQERLTHAEAVIAEVLKAPREIVVQAGIELRRRARAGGGERIVSRGYRISYPKLSRSAKPDKRITDLLELRGKITPAEFSKAFSGKTVINVLLDADTLAKIKALVPGGDSVVQTDIDVDGGVLNSLKKNYGSESEVGKIIDAGYKSNKIEYDGELTIEPVEELAHKTNVDDAIKGNVA